MKLCDLTQSYADSGGGVRTYLHAKREHVLARTNAEHVLIVPGPRDRTVRSDRAVTYRVASPRVPGSDVYRLLLRSDKVLRILARERPALVEAQCAYNLPWTALYHRRRHGGRAVGAYMTDFPRAYVEPAVTSLLGSRAGRAARAAAEHYARALYNRCDATLAISRTVANRLVSAGVRNVRHLPLGVDLETFRPSRRDPAVRRRLGATGRELLLVYVGRLDRERRPDMVVDAFARLPASFPARLVLVGAGPLREALEARAASDDRIRVLPFESDRRALATLLASADVYVSAMPDETFGLAVVEAQACGLPVVGVRSGAMVDRVAEGTGVLCAPGSPEAMAERIRAFSRTEWRRMGRNARRMVEAEYSWRATFRRLFALYRRLGVPVTAAASASGERAAGGTAGGRDHRS